MDEGSNSRSRLVEPAFWLFPISQLAHLAEEALGNYQFHRVLPDGTTLVPLDVTAFVLLQAGYTLVLLVGMLAARRFRRMRWLISMFSALLVANAYLHARASIRQGGYVSGVITAVGLWVPLAAYGLWKTWQESRWQCAGGMMVGVLLQKAIFYLSVLLTSSGGMG